jgi:hypothetical protein
LGEKATDSSNDDPAMLFLFSSPRRSGTLRRNNEWSQRSGHKKIKIIEKREGKKECKSRRQDAHEQVKERCTERGKIQEEGKDH